MIISVLETLFQVSIDAQVRVMRVGTPHRR
jgi:hypothetical protein